MMQKERQGFVPKRGTDPNLSVQHDSQSKRLKVNDSPIMYVLDLVLSLCLLILSRIRERILQNGFIENGTVLEVLPPSGAPLLKGLGIERHHVIVTFC
jgi:hypothetical protein